MEGQNQEQQGGNEDIRNLRAKAKAYDNLAEEKRSLEAKFLEACEKAETLEREKLSEFEKLQRDLKAKDDKITQLNSVVGELSPFKEKVSKWGETFQGLYQSKLSGIDETFRPKIEALSADGDWPDRLSKLEAAMELLPKEGTTSLGSKGGPSQGSGTTPQGGPKHDMEALAKDTGALWGAAFGK